MLSARNARHSVFGILGFGRAPFGQHVFIGKLKSDDMRYLLLQTDTDSRFLARLRGAGRRQWMATTKVITSPSRRRFRRRAAFGPARST